MSLAEDFSLDNNALNNGRCLASDPLAKFVQEIDIIFQAPSYSYISDQSIGKVNMDDLLFDRNINKQHIISNIEQEISLTNGADDYLYTIGIRFLRGELRDIVIIDVVISPGTKNEFKRSYIFK